jgi:hypothetical protein
LQPDKPPAILLKMLSSKFQESEIPLVVILGYQSGRPRLPSISGTLMARLFQRIRAFQGMDIGFKPTHEAGTVPHHLIDVADPDQILSLAEFQRLARQAISAVHARGRLPFLVGGTGQYVRAVTEAWQIPPAAPDNRLRLAWEHWAASIGHGLRPPGVVDPGAAQIDYRNRPPDGKRPEVFRGNVFDRGRQSSYCFIY